MSSPVTRGDVEEERQPAELVEESREDDAKEHEEEEGDVSSLNNVVHEGAAWLDDAASTGTAFREETSKFESDGEWAQNLFYAYARRTDDPRFSRFLLTFSNAHVCTEWWSLIQHHFGGPPSNTREGAQFFSFLGDNIPGRAWKHQSFGHLRTKWMYSQIGDAVGAMGKGQEIIPLQDERGFLVQGTTGRTPTPEPDRAPSRTGSIADSINNRDKLSRPLRRMSKRDSGILLPSSPLVNHERSHSLPATPPDPRAQVEKLFDFERMEQNLARIERLMESNASQLRSLEHVQAANLERLTVALVHNAEMIRELGTGQQKLGEACEGLRTAVREREEKSERVSLRSIGGGSVGSGSVENVGTCGHDVKRGPRKIGRAVVGYIYADGHETKTVGPGRQR